MLKGNKDDQLRELLQMKRFDVPSEENWNAFDRLFENKRLAAIKDPFSKKVFAYISHIFNFKRIVYSAGVGTMLIVLIMTSVKTTENIIESRIAMETSHEYVKFVNDGMLAKCHTEGSRFEMCNINYTNDGIDYALDSLKMSNNQSLLARM